jgi:hypothetical protein
MQIHKEETRNYLYIYVNKTFTACLRYALLRGFTTDRNASQPS